MVSSTCLSVLVCSVVFFFWTMLAFFSTFMAYNWPRSGPRIFLTRNTFPYAPVPRTLRRSKSFMLTPWWFFWEAWHCASPQSRNKENLETRFIVHEKIGEYPLFGLCFYTFIVNYFFQESKKRPRHFLMKNNRIYINSRIMFTSNGLVHIWVIVRILRLQMLLTPYWGLSQLEKAQCNSWSSILWFS